MIFPSINAILRHLRGHPPFYRATGYITMKVGKMAAIAVGGGIILLQMANQQGIISIDWNKVQKKVDKVTDKVEEAVTGQGPSWADKVRIGRAFGPRAIILFPTVAHNITTGKQSKKRELD